MVNKQATTVIDGKAIFQIMRSVGVNTVIDELTDRLYLAVKNFNTKETEIPVREGFNYNIPHLGLIEWMPLFKREEEVVIKVVGYHPHNPAIYKLPTILSTISGYDAHTGHLKYLMDGVLLTALRTGAASAVASKLMAPKGSSTLGIIGCGAQSVTQIHALSRVFDFKEILIYDSDRAAMESLPNRISPINLDLNPTLSDIDSILKKSDIICTATSIGPHAGPLFKDYECKDHVHINAIGADFPGKTELPLRLLKESFVSPDFLTQAIKEGECQQLDSGSIAPSWVEVINNPDLQRQAASTKSVFDSTGWALEDQVVADLFAEYAKNLALGTPMVIEAASEDEKSPYGMLLNESQVYQ